MESAVFIWRFRFESAHDDTNHYLLVSRRSTGYFHYCAMVGVRQNTTLSSFHMRLSKETLYIINPFQSLFIRKSYVVSYVVS